MNPWEKIDRATAGLSAVRAVFGDEKAASEWLWADNPRLGRVPFDLLMAGSADRVVREARRAAA